jgi:DNA-binding NarL/FixJ family response regulator
MKRYVTLDRVTEQELQTLITKHEKAGYKVEQTGVVLCVTDKPRRFTPKEDQTIMRMRRKGSTFKEISQKLRRHPATILVRAKRIGAQ